MTSDKARSIVGLPSAGCVRQKVCMAQATVTTHLFPH